MKETKRNKIYMYLSICAKRKRKDTCRDKEEGHELEGVMGMGRVLNVTLWSVLTFRNYDNVS